MSLKVFFFLNIDDGIENQGEALFIHLSLSSTFGLLDGSFYDKNVFVFDKSYEKNYLNYNVFQYLSLFHCGSPKG